MNDMWVCVSFIDACQWQLVGGYGPNATAIQTNAQHEGQFGIYSGPNAVPGGRLGAAAWSDASGNFFLFGGSDGAHFMNDFWKYDTSAFTSGAASTYTGTTGTWSVVGGSAAVDQPGVYTGGTLVPGARTNALTWKDASGNFWLFGGFGYDSARAIGDLNDLWEYNGTVWIWVSGGNTNLANQKGIYGSQGVAASTNMPGGRHEAAGWADANGNLWVFGGEGEDSAGTAFGFLNNLWMYNIAANKWTWVAGSNMANQNGVYPQQPVIGSAATQIAAGTCGLPVGDANLPCAAISLTGAFPGSRWGASAWIDSNGSFWLFGGWGSIPVQPTETAHSTTCGYIPLTQRRDNSGLGHGSRVPTPALKWHVRRRTIRLEDPLHRYSGWAQQQHGLDRRHQQPLLALRRRRQRSPRPPPAAATSTICGATSRISEIGSITI